VLTAGWLWVFNGWTGCGLSVDCVTGWMSGVDLGDEICTVFCNEDSSVLDFLSTISLIDRWRLPEKPFLRELAIFSKDFFRSSNCFLVSSASF
jgi:hypothetical protein